MDLNDPRYQLYLAERKLLIEAEREGAQAFDRAILTLAAGAFGLSLAFIKQIIPEGMIQESLAVLIGAWVSFCLSLLATLLSFLTSQAACECSIRIVEAVYGRAQERPSAEASPQKNPAAAWTWRLNVTSIVAFMVGVVCLAAFSIWNLAP